MFCNNRCKHDRGSGCKQQVFSGSLNGSDLKSLRGSGSDGSGSGRMYNKENLIPNCAVPSSTYSGWSGGGQI